MKKTDNWPGSKEPPSCTACGQRTWVQIHCFHALILCKLPILSLNTIAKDKSIQTI